MSGKEGIIKGIGGSMSFDGEFVTISKTRLTGAKGNKRVHFSQIAGVEIKSPTLMKRGYVRIATSDGGNTGRRAKTKFDPVTDENRVLCKTGQAEEFEGLRAAIEARIAKGVDGALPVPDVADRIANLAQLHAAGTLTDAEFTAAKASLLAQ